MVLLFRGLSGSWVSWFHWAEVRPAENAAGSYPGVDTIAMTSPVGASMTTQATLPSAMQRCAANSWMSASSVSTISLPGLPSSREISRDEGSPGKEIVLTLDADIQEFAAQRCIAEGSVACVVMDAPTGEVMAMVSTPGYDPAAFSAGLTSAQWNQLTQDPLNPLNNKTISGTYAPGSTFKPMVALAALESGISPETRVTCPGFFRLGDSVWHCWRPQGHGTLDMHGGIMHSCDVYFYEMARRLGIDRFAAMAKRFGLGATLGIDI